MFKLWATIKKDFKILSRDRMGMVLMFIMPILLAVVIASVQNSTFELVNKNKIPVLMLNKDTGRIASELEAALEKAGVFKIQKDSSVAKDEEELKKRINTKDALVAIVIPADYSASVLGKAEAITNEALKGIISEEDKDTAKTDIKTAIRIYYHPVLQPSFRKSIDATLQTALQFIQNKYIVNRVYFSIHEEEIPVSLEEQITTNQTPVEELPVSNNHVQSIPNATQHNIPAWTIFAMFFIVISLGSSIVREKISGSMIRLRTLPTPFGLAVLSKQMTYITVTLLQAIVIFSIGIWLFPLIGLPALNLPSHPFSLVLVTLICGWCAASFAICVGVYANTQEQANGFGAVVVVLMAAIGGLLVPSFVMPPSFRTIMLLSPLHWCLEAFYGLFLEDSGLRNILSKIIPLLIITVLLQIIAFWGLKHKNLI